MMQSLMMTNLLHLFANWIESTQLQASDRFTFTKQTNASVITLRSTASILEDLLSEGYKYVLISRLRNDPLERHFL